MISTLAGLLAGLFALLAGLFAAILGLSIGAAAMVASMLPILVLLLIPLLPLLFILWILRRFGLFRGRAALVVVLLLAVGLAISGAGYGWQRGVEAAKRWMEDNRDVMEACNSQSDASLSLESDEDGWHLVCYATSGRARPAHKGTPI